MMTDEQKREIAAEKYVRRKYGPNFNNIVLGNGLRDFKAGYDAGAATLADAERTLDAIRAMLRKNKYGEWEWSSGRGGPHRLAILLGMAVECGVCEGECRELGRHA
jgi:hypothetical protein